MRLVMFLHPLDFDYNLGGRKVHPLTSSIAGFVIVGQSLALFAYSYLPLVWSEIVFRTRTLRLDGKSAWKVRLGVRSYQLFVLVSRLAAFGVTGRAAVPFASAIVVLGLLGVLVIFVVARGWFIGLFNASIKTMELQTMRKRINTLTNIVVPGFTVATMSLAIYLIVISQGGLSSCPKGGVCLTYLGRDICSLSGKRSLSLQTNTETCNLCESDSVYGSMPVSLRVMPGLPQVVLFR